MDYSILENDPTLGLQVDTPQKESLQTTAKWAKIISIITLAFAIVLVAFVVMFLQRINDIDTTSFRSTGNLREMGTGFIVGICVFVLAVIIIVLYFLLNFANKTARGLRMNNMDDIEQGIASLKVFFIIMGVAGILGLLSSISELF